MSTDQTRPLVPRRPARWHTGGPAAAGRLLGRLRARLEEQHRAEAHRMLEAGMRGLWREACTGVGLCQYIPMPTGVTIRTPKFGALCNRPGVAFSVELLPGGEPDDWVRKPFEISHLVDRIRRTLERHRMLDSASHTARA